MLCTWHNMQGEMEHLYPESSVKEIAKAAAREAVEEAFALAGLNMNDPIRLQRQMQILAAMSEDEERIEDHLFLRRLRKRCDSWVGYVGASVIGLIIVSFGTLLALGFRSWGGWFPPPAP